MSTKQTREFVTKIVAEANEMLKVSLCSEDRRQGQIDIVEHMLHSAKMYKGFRYLMVNEVPEGCLPGIVVNGTVEDTPYEVRFAIGTVDRTRVQYFI